MCLVERTCYITELTLCVKFSVLSKMTPNGHCKSSNQFRRTTFSLLFWKHFILEGVLILYKLAEVQVKRLFVYLFISDASKTNKHPYIYILHGVL